jgi:hypothetical protein
MGGFEAERQAQRWGKGLVFEAALAMEVKL